MKDDKLEQYIRSNKSEMEEDFDVEASWTKLAPKVRGYKSQRLWKVYAVAASLMLCMGLAMVLFQHNRPVQDEQFSATAAGPEVENARMQYATLIELKRAEINSFRTEQPELCKDFDAQFAELDRMYLELIKQSNDENKREVVLQAMIENLQMQLNILNQQLEIIQQVNMQKNERK